MYAPQIEPAEQAKRSLSVGQIEGKIKRYEIVELGGTNGIAAGTLGRVAFMDQPQLRNQPGQIIIITNVEVFLDTVYANSQFNNAINGMPAADLPNAVLVLYVGQEESIHYLPLAKLNHIEDAAGNPFQWDLQGFDRLTDVSWDKSYVQFSAATSATFIVPFGVTYFRFKFDPSNSQWIEK